MNEPQLDERQKKFCQLVVAGGKSNAESYRLAGYAPGGANAGASRLLSRDSIRAYIKHLGDLAGPAPPTAAEIEAARALSANREEAQRAEVKAIRDARKCLEELDALVDVAEEIADPGERIREKRRTLTELLKHQERLAGLDKKEDTSVSDVIGALGQLFKATPEREK